MKLKKVKDLIQKTLWSNFGEEKLTMAVKAVEDKLESLASFELSGNKEAFDFLFDYLERLVKKAKDLHKQWKFWAPPAEQKDFQWCIHHLKQAISKLISRKADFIQAKPKEDAEKVTTAPTS